MKIRKVHCLFEQSGTFRDCFRKRGYEAYDYDIANDFGTTDIQIDLFCHILAAWEGCRSCFDSFTHDDLVFAFFPCTYFCGANWLFFSGKHNSLDTFNLRRFVSQIETRNIKRAKYYTTLLQLFAVAKSRNLRMVVENPWTRSYLKDNFPWKPSLVDYDRSSSGDKYKKPTAYWFLGFNPFRSKSFTLPHSQRTTISSQNGCKGRSIISSCYADNFLNDHVFCLPGSSYQQSDFFDGK